jgi:hypothetical protein
MGRSRVYCTPPANANRQHNTAAARTIPLGAPGEWRASSGPRGRVRTPALPRVRDAGLRAGHHKPLHLGE